MRVLLAVLLLVAAGCSQGVPRADVASPGIEPDGAAETRREDGDGDASPRCAPPVETDPGAWYRQAVGYEIFVRSFKDSDGDGIGDFTGLIEALDHLNDGRPGEGDDLEVDLVWLMPIHPSPSDHGYDVTDYRGVHPDYGGPAAFDAFLQEARRRGVHVIIDLVVNHTSVQHPWFLASASGTDRGDWYVWRPDAPAWTRPWGGGPVWHPRGQRFYYGLFWEGMPDLNVLTPGVTGELHETARYWLDRGVDGFRLDAVRYLVESGPGPGQQDTPETLDWWVAFAAAMRLAKPDVLLVGEAWTSNALASLYHAGGEGLSMTFDFDLSAAILGAVKASDATDVEGVLCRFGGQFPPAAADGVFLTNHDMVRVASDLGEEDAATRLAAALLFAMPGTPWIYYGEEIGMRNGAALDDRAKRKPMQWAPGPGGGFTSGTPWQPLHPDTDAINVEVQRRDPDSLLSLYRALIRARRAHPALQRGDAAPVPATSPTSGEVWALRRVAGAEAVVAVFNLGESSALAVTVDPSQPVTTAVDLISGEAVPVTEGRLEAGDMGPRAFRYLRILP